MSEYYLLNNRPAVAQGVTPRRSKVSGVIVVHTDEAPQQAGGALGTAGFISRRTDYGCYHIIVDSTTVVRMLPPLTWETWGARSPADTNTHAIHLSFRGQAHRWGQDPAYDEAALQNAGKEIANVMKMLHGDDAAKYVRWITRQDCINRIPGLVEHGTIQPEDRGDPWVGRKDQASLRDRLSKAILKNLITTPVPEGVDDDMTKQSLIKIGTKVWLFYGDTPWRVHVRTPADVNTFRFLGVPYRELPPQQGEFFLRYSQEVKTGGK